MNHHTKLSDDEFHKQVVLLLSAENRRLRKAIALTLKENSHLADGKQCTLRHLKDALKP